MSACSFIARLILTCAAAWGVSLSAFADPAPRSGACGDGGHLWLVAPSANAADGWVVLHYGPGMNEGAQPVAAQVEGGVGQPVRLPSGGPAIAARGGSLYVAQQNTDGSVQVVEVTASAPGPDDAPGEWSYASHAVMRLPAQAQLRALAADDKSILLAVESLSGAWLGPAAPNAKAAGRPSPEVALVLGLPPVHAAIPEKAAPEKKLAPPLSGERKLWVLRCDGSKPVLLRELKSAQNVFLATDTHGKWLSCSGDATRLLYAADQMLLAQVAFKNEMKDQVWINTLRADWTVIRESQRISAGSCALAADANTGWGLCQWAGNPALVVVPATFKSGQWAARIAPVKLNGEVLPILELRQEIDLKDRQEGALNLLLAVFAVAVGLMVWNFRRGALRILPRLPSGLMPASFWRRLCAVLIDLSLAVVPVSLAAHEAVPAILRYWPGAVSANQLGGLEDMRPGFICAAVFILHTAIGEMLFGRSIGKLFTGLWVVGLDGKRAALWRIALRGALKILELLSPMLFSLALFSPFRQRLGDLTAGTVVVEQRRPTNPGSHP